MLQIYNNLPKIGVSLGWDKKSPSVETERPLTIACHMKILIQQAREQAAQPRRGLLTNDYFLVVSTAAAAAVSTVAAAESTTGATAAVSATTAAESALTSLFSPAQAAKVPMARTNNSFFIFLIFGMNDLMVNTGE
jgi:hypothetical protein